MINKEVVKAGTTDLDIQRSVGLDATLAMVEQRAGFVDRLHVLIQKHIDPEKDIKKIGDKYRRTINFARKCYRVIGGSIEWQRLAETETGLPFHREARTDAEGPYFVYTCACTWITPWGERVEGWSLISSREPFFGVVDEGFKPVSEVEEHDIAEMCKSEAFKSCIFTGLGFSKDISEDELTALGKDGGKSGGHGFSKERAGRQGGSKDTSEESGDLRAKIEKACAELVDIGWAPDGAPDFNKPEDVLKFVTANPTKNWEGWRTFRAIKETQLNRIHEQLDDILKECGV